MKKLLKIETELGQATTEYALVLLGAAVIALLVIAWATDGGGAGRIGELAGALWLGWGLVIMPKHPVRAAFLWGLAVWFYH